MVKVTLNNKQYLISETIIQEVIESLYKINQMEDKTLKCIDLNCLTEFVEDNCVNFVGK